MNGVRHHQDGEYGNLLVRALGYDNMGKGGNMYKGGGDYRAPPYASYAACGPGDDRPYAI